MADSKFILKGAFDIWSSQNMKLEQVKQEINIDLQKKLLNLISAGDFYYYIFNAPELKFDYVSDEVIHVLGYQPEQFTVDFYLSIIHPDDQKMFVDFENTLLEFFQRVPPEKFFNYKVRYDYRVRRKDGTYIRILHQVVTINYSRDGGIIHTFGVHTDISHLKTTNRTTLSVIGLNGEPSYFDLPVSAYRVDSKNGMFTKRERELLSFLWEGYSNEQIAVAMNITVETVKSMRKKMMAKSGASNAVTLVKMAFQNGEL